MSLSLKSAAAEFPGSGAGDKGRRRKRRELSEEQKQEIVEAFNLFDTDKDQAIDYHELKVNHCISHWWKLWAVCWPWLKCSLVNQTLPFYSAGCIASLACVLVLPKHIQHCGIGGWFTRLGWSGPETRLALSLSWDIFHDSVGIFLEIRWSLWCL